MMIHFIRPDWLWLLIPAFIYLMWVIFNYRQNNPWKKACDPHLLKVLSQSSTSKSNRMGNLSMICLFSIAIFALAGPAWTKSKLPVYQEISSIMLVLDLSSAMQATDIKPDRLMRAKLKIRDLITAAQNTQMGLVVFTDEAFIASPLSQDANTLSEMLEELSPQMMPLAGSDIGQGLSQSLALLRQASVNQGNILLITASDPSAASWEMAKTIAQSGHQLSILAMLESSATTQATISKLQQLAKMGNGQFYLFTAQSSDIRDILNFKNKEAVKNDNLENALVWQDQGPWFCLLLIPFALIVIREKIQHEKSL